MSFAFPLVSFAFYLVSFDFYLVSFRLAIVRPNDTISVVSSNGLPPNDTIVSFRLPIASK